MKIAALIVAAGRGSRAGGLVPKQWQVVNGKRIIDHTLDLFVKHPKINRIMTVLHSNDLHRLDPTIERTVGGPSRQVSVLNGLKALSKNPPDVVLIHDVARATTPTHIISNVIEALETNQGAAPALPVTDALWQGEGGIVRKTILRDGLFRAQTPQGFHFAAILAAHHKAIETARDDVEVALQANLSVAIVDGSKENIKLTHPEDFERVGRILEDRSMEVRIGHGFDVHAFKAGDHVMLFGVKIPHKFSLNGHSDADVALHALTDAIYGALADGDIGRHFPPDKAEWKGAASEVFLKHAVALSAKQGFRVSNLDCTIICETPKIAPHWDVMRRSVADITQIPERRISIKATTSENLGFIGREEGIAAMATACLLSK